MFILAIETTGPKCSAAVIDESGRVRETESGGRYIHLRHLIPMVSQLLENCQLKIDDITAIATSCGPGSFTGIRIGVTTARALAQALDVPAIPVPTLESFVYNDEKCTDVICPIFDARRHQIYGAAYIYDGEDGTTELVKGGAYTLEEYMDLATSAAARAGKETLVFYGDGARVYAAAIEEHIEKAGLEAEIRDEVQQAASVARLGLKLYNEGKTVPYGLLRPEYMREAEAQRKLEEKKRAEDKGVS